MLQREKRQIDMAKKYIDADKLKAEIKERLHCNGSFDECGDTAWDYDQGMIAAYNYVLSFIDSLQQEQPKGDLAENIEMEWDSFNKNVAEYGGESEDVVWLNWFSFTDIATYFYELGRKGGSK